MQAEHLMQSATSGDVTLTVRKHGRRSHLAQYELRRHDSSVEWVQVGTIIGVLTAVVGLAVGLQSFWIARALDRIHATLDRLDVRFDHVEGVVLRDHAERIARLEARFD